jgi:DNA-binding response OmpR family regulator
VRPKRIILYVSASDQQISLMAFMLRTRGYAVLTTSDREEAAGIVVQYDVAVAMVDLVIGTERGCATVERLKAIKPYLPVIMLGDPAKMADEAMYADASMSKHVDPAKLLERIKVMAQRKRGPRKGSPAALRCGKRTEIESEVVVA